MNTIHTERRKKQTHTEAVRDKVKMHTTQKEREREREAESFGGWRSRSKTCGMTAKRESSPRKADGPAQRKVKKRDNKEKLRREK